MEKKINGEERVLQYMRETGYITSWRAIAEFGITRLSAVIYRLRKRGYNIQTETVTGKIGITTLCPTQIHDRRAKLGQNSMRRFSRYNFAFEPFR